VLVRRVAAVLSLAFLLLAVPDLALQGHAAVVSATVAVLLASVLVLHGRRDRLILASPVASTRGPDEEERCLHGAFRRMTSPNTPGRLGRPRAPGQEFRPA
jgi:hypothetical protein